MPLNYDFSAAFEYILNSNFSLVQKYRKPKPLFEPDKHSYDFNVTEKYSAKSIRICEYNQNIDLCGRYKVALESCGFNVFTDFDGFGEIRGLFNSIFHNWHSVCFEINEFIKNNSLSANTRYKAFIDSFAFALLVSEKDQQFMFFMPLTARKYYSGIEFGCVLNFYTLYVLVPKKRITEFSASDLYWEMYSQKIGRSMNYEHRNLKLRAYKSQKQSICLHDNLTKHIGINHLYIKPFDSTCSFEVNELLNHKNLSWLYNCKGKIFNSFCEIQTFMFRHLTSDFIFLTNYYYEGNKAENIDVFHSGGVEHSAVVGWIDVDGRENIIKINKKDNILKLGYHRVSDSRSLNAKALYEFLRQPS